MTTAQGVTWTRTLSLLERKSLLAFANLYDAKSRDRGGGVKRDKTGKMEEMGNSKEDKTLIENMKQGYPVMLIVGKYHYVPSAMMTVLKTIQGPRTKTVQRG